MVQPSRVSENWPTAPDDCKSGPIGPPSAGPPPTLRNGRVGRDAAEGEAAGRVTEQFGRDEVADAAAQGAKPIRVLFLPDRRRRQIGPDEAKPQRNIGRRHVRSAGDSSRVRALDVRLDAKDKPIGTDDCSRSARRRTRRRRPPRSSRSRPPPRRSSRPQEQRKNCRCRLERARPRSRRRGADPRNSRRSDRHRSLPKGLAAERIPAGPCAPGTSRRARVRKLGGERVAGVIDDESEIGPVSVLPPRDVGKILAELQGQRLPKGAP